jgi:polyisoprenyl-phosphate glycosyltransferase
MTTSSNKYPILKIGKAEMEISVIIPSYNEQDTLPQTFKKLHETLENITMSFEMIFVNDGSSDDTEIILDEYAAKYSFIKSVHLSRNFGKEAAMSVGLDMAEGDCIIIIDADLQHPPELISVMHKKWCEGYDVVNAVKKSRGNESFLYNFFARSFNHIMSRSVGVNYTGASDFKLLDRQVVQALEGFHERNRFFRGLVAWVGFKSYDVEFDVKERYAGSSKWSIVELIRYSVRNIISFSSWPLLFIAYTGFSVASLGLILLLQTLINYITGNAVGGFTTVIALQILLSGIILFSLGIISIYLAKIYDEQKSRPIAVTKKKRVKE